MSRHPSERSPWADAPASPWLPRRTAVVPRLVAGVALASGGVEAAAVALAIVVYERTGSPLWVSAALVSSLGLSALLGPLGGVVADRYPRRTVMTAVTAAEACVFVAVAVVPETWQLVALSALGAVVMLPFEGSATAVIPTLVPDDQLPSATSAIAAAQQAATLIAPVAAGAALSAVSRTPVYLVIAALFVVASVVVRSLPPVPVSAVRSTVRRELGEGFRALVGDRVILAVTVAGVLLIAFSAATLVAGVAMSREELDAGQAGYGLMVSAWGAGMVAGSLLAGRLMGRHTPLTVIAVGMLLAGLSLSTVAAAPNLGVALVSLAAGGIGNGAMNTAEMLLYQRRIPNAVLGRVRAAAVACLRVAYAVSFLAGGVLADAAGPRAVFAVSGIGVMLTAVPVLALLIRREQAPAAPPAQPD